MAAVRCETVAPATYINSTALLCAVPPLPAGDYVVGVSFDNSSLWLNATGTVLTLRAPGTVSVLYDTDRVSREVSL